MKKDRICYFSRNYYNISSAGNKAKTDYEKILVGMGAVNIGLSCRISNNRAAAFFYNLASVVKACFCMRHGDTVVMQYPVKKYFSLVCGVAHMKGARTVSLIHDLGSFRRKKLSVEHELRRLGHTDWVIATNSVMRDWLEQHGISRPVGELGFHDYLSPVSCPVRTYRTGDVWNIVYAGSLSLRKNAFILQMKEIDSAFRFHLYGGMSDYDAVASDRNIIKHDFMASDDFIAGAVGHFGLVWDGDSLDECHGDFGGYLRYNTPHKASFYLRAGLPLIVWRGAAIAWLVEDEGVGMVVDSLRDVPGRLARMSASAYDAMVANVVRVAAGINRGDNLRKAMHEVEFLTF